MNRDTLLFLAVHSTHWLVLYLAFAVGSEGALRVLLFVCWGCALFLPMMHMKAAQAELLKRPAHGPLRSASTRVQSWLTLALLVWFGHIPTAVAWAFAMFNAAVVDAGLKELRAAAAQPNGTGDA